MLLNIHRSGFQLAVTNVIEEDSLVLWHWN
jgi:hypothetical protein